MFEKRRSFTEKVSQEAKFLLETYANSKEAIEHAALALEAAQKKETELFWAAVLTELKGT